MRQEVHPIVPGEASGYAPGVIRLALRPTLLLLALTLATACKKGETSEPCHAVNTGAAGAKTGATTAIKGVEQAGSATVGLFEGGGSEAKARWKEGGQETKKTAREGKSETKSASHDKQCH